MNQEIKKLWLKALRSGKYKQGKFYLRQREEGKKEDTYCCLGVLCDVLIKNKLIDIEISKTSLNICHDDSTHLKYGYNNSFQSLPKEITKFTKLFDCDQQNLQLLNDEHNWNFKKIAGWIEKNIQDKE